MRFEAAYCSHAPREEQPPAWYSTAYFEARPHLDALFQGVNVNYRAKAVDPESI